jgi:NADH-quinone oxidoreductase subunit N
VLAAASAFAAFFLGLELLSVSLFGMIAYRRGESPGTEASIKYLVLAGVSAAFVLFGMALAYAETGSMELASVLAALAAGTRGLLVPGIGLMIVGIGFKLAVVPFHLWTPDVYDGAPAPVAGYIATVSKGAVAVLLMRLLGPAIAAVHGPLPWVFGVIAALSMFIGNLLALRESNVKRILAYSSIANLGYLLVAFLAPAAEARRAVAFYLVAYFAAALGAFAAVTALSTREREAADLEAYRGIARTRPWLTAGFTVALLSLAGLPLTAGFVGKFIILQAGAGAGQWALAIMLVINSTISIFYYLKVVSAMYRSFDEGAAGAARGSARAHPLAGLSLALLSVVAVALGVYPAPLLRLIEQLAAG